MITSPNQQEENALSQILSQRIAINREFVLYAVIFLLAVFTRFYILDARVMSHDESLHTRFSYNLYADGSFQHTPLMHGPVLFHATAFSYFIFGDSDFSSRIYPALLGVLMVMFPLLFRKWLGKWGAMLASMMLLISPLILYYNRYIRHDTPSIFYGMVMAYCILMYINGSPRFRRRACWLYLFAAAMVLNLGSKETAFIYIAIFGSFLCIYWLVRLIQHRSSRPGKPILYSIMLGILLGGMMTLGMYIIVDIIPVEIIPGRGTPWGDLSDLQRSSWMSWMLLTVFSSLFVLASTALYAFRGRWRRIPWRETLLIFLIALLTAGGLLFIEELSHFPTSTEVAEAAPDAAGAEAEAVQPASTMTWLPVIALWLIMFVSVGLLIYNRRRQNRDLWGFLRSFPEFDFIILIVTLILPWTTALFPRLMNASGSDAASLAQALPEGIYNLLLNLPNLSSAEQVGQFMLGAYAFVPLFILMMAIGLAWNWRRWLIASAIFHVLFAFFFTTVFTNISGLATGMIYSLGYWLEQQGVRRGSQPQYYYLLVIMPMYEFLPIIGSVAAMFAGVTGFWKMRRRRINEIETAPPPALEAELANPDAEAAPDEPPNPQPPTITDGESQQTDDHLRKIPFLLLLAWWAILNLVGYSLAGEKMPWLATHLTTPMILLTAWYFGGILSRIDKSMFLARGWIALLIMPLFVVTCVQVIGAFAAGSPPFAGLAQSQLEHTYGWLASLTLAIGLGAVLFRIARQTRWIHVRRICAMTIFGLLSLITFRSAWLASFINYDLPTEFLVYAHAAPAVKWVLEDIEEMSLRMADGKTLKFAYDNEVSWPYSWYFRDYPSAVYVESNPTVQNLNDAIFVVVGSGNRGKVEPILEDRYWRRDHMRMWWPMQDYFHLTPERLLNTLDFSAANEDGAAFRRGIFDIWWSRDYDQYGAAASQNFSLADWPVSDRMHVYIRKDFAAQIWEYGVGDGAVTASAPAEVNQCSANWKQIAPLVIEADPPLSQPLGLSVASGFIYVAEEYTNQVSSFTTDGELVQRFGGDPSGQAVFYRPNSVAAMADGGLLVVDTWNHRIQRIDAAGNPVAQWGQAGQFGFDAPSDPADGFWGPRDAVISADGRVYVADTGNKRVRVYALDGLDAAHQFDIGKGGSGAGELDEPSGLALHSDGRLFVADTWNQRIAVFDAHGNHLENFRVRGWYNDTVNRPYLALDEDRHFLYISDPDSKRILVYHPSGSCIGSFGQEGSVGAIGQFEGIGGIAIDDEGFVYASDSVAGKIYKFPPFPAPPVESASEDQAGE